MALEKDIIEQGLESNGLDKALADKFSFETEEQMNATLEGLKPHTYGDIEDVMKDEKLSKLVRTYGDKRLSDLQSKIDKDKADKNKDQNKDEKKPDEEPAWAKTMRERQEAIEQRQSADDFKKQVSKLAKDEGLGDADVKQVQKGLKSDATEDTIKAEIKEYKQLLSEKGIKEFGTPGGGSGNTASIKSAAEAFKKKKLKKN